jgi:precorrin-6Y C5,15-methyltransferase (decarboxylating)
VTILGLDDPRDLAPSALALLGQAEVVAGPARLMEAVDQALKPEALRLPLTHNLPNWLKEVAGTAAKGEIVILADGDPNFFGLGAWVINAFSGRAVTMRPAITTVQKAFALMGVTWAGVETVSLHGRYFDEKSFFSALFRAGRATGSGRLAVYTDQVNNPNLIAQQVLSRGQDFWRMSVFQNLGLPDQSVWSGSLDQAVTHTFSPLNLAILERREPPKTLTLGASEEVYAHQADLITKSEVRSVALGLLELKGDEIMWDLGCGSGSVSMEASLILPYGSLYAVEKDPLRAKQARKNRSLYGLAHLEIVNGLASKVVKDLPPPNRIFLGGGGCELESLIQTALCFLSPGGVVVVAVVRLDSLQKAISVIKADGQFVSVTQVSASRGAPLAGSIYLKPINPVFLIKARAPV